MPADARNNGRSVLSTFIDCAGRVQKKQALGRSKRVSKDTGRARSPRPEASCLCSSVFIAAAEGGEGVGGGGGWQA